MKRLTHDICQKTADAFNRKTPLPAGIKFRAGTISDLDAIMEVGTACFASDLPERPKIRHFLTKAHAAIAVICDGEDIIGYVHVEAHAGRNNTYLNTTALLDEYRGKGLGNLLYAFSNELTRSVGAQSIWCHAAVDNEITLHLLQKNGFAIERTIDPYYYDDGKAAHVLRHRMKDRAHP